MNAKPPTQTTNLPLFEDGTFKKIKHFFFGGKLIKLETTKIFPNDTFGDAFIFSSQRWKKSESNEKENIGCIHPDKKVTLRK